MAGTYCVTEPEFELFCEGATLPVWARWPKYVTVSSAIIPAPLAGAGFLVGFGSSFRGPFEIALLSLRAVVIGGFALGAGNSEAGLAATGVGG